MNSPQDFVSNNTGVPFPSCLVYFSLLLTFLTGCDECKTAADCGVGNICQNGDCVSVEISDSDSDMDTDTDTNTETNSNTDSDTDSSSDTDTGDPLLENGEVCSFSKECKSGHCGDGFCCASGECCGTVADASDCDDSLCVQRYCDGNFQCIYHELDCAVADTMDGETCQDTHLCDGLGGCAAVDICNASYAHDSTYTCTVGVVEENCHDSCVDANQCNTGYFCSDNSTCLAFLQNGQDGCSSNSHCLSGYCYLDTGICCESDICCNSNDECLPLTCDTGTWSCFETCDIGAGDVDTLCVDGYHCDGGWCFEDLLDLSPCNENSDCVSRYCHPTLNICFVSDCSPTGIEDDALCTPLGQYHCDGDICVPDINNGDSGCDENTDCESGDCDLSNGICCDDSSSGCCASPLDCDDSEDCTTDYCTAGSFCFNAPLDDGADCADDLFCNGLEKCLGGICQPGTYPCTGGSACVQDECFEDQNPPCVYTPVGDGTYCSAGTVACLDDQYAQCFSGVCGPPISSGFGLEGNCGDTPSPCTRYLCNYETGNCDIENESNVTPCDDSDPCNGDDQCFEGTCEHEGNPCVDGNPCTTDTCTPNGSAADCTFPAIPNGGQCEADPCLGTQSATQCWGGECVMDPARDCNNSNICTIESCVGTTGTAVCNNTIANPDSNIVNLSCNTTTTVFYEDFTSSDYYSLAGCGTHAGKEAIVRINPTSPSVTITVPSYDSSWTHTFGVLSLGNPQSPTDYCTDSAACANVTGVPQILTVGTDHYFVLDYVEALPAPTTSVSVQVVCL